MRHKSHNQPHYVPICRPLFVTNYDVYTVYICTYIYILLLVLFVIHYLLFIIYYLSFIVYYYYLLLSASGVISCIAYWKLQQYFGDCSIENHNSLHRLLGFNGFRWNNGKTMENHGKSWHIILMDS